MRLNDFKREAERFADIDRAAGEGTESAESSRGAADGAPDQRQRAPANNSTLPPPVCASCDNTCCDSSTGEPCSQCPTGAAFRAELASLKLADAGHGYDPEPCYGPCARCPRQGEVWRVNGEWLCESCKESA